MAYIETVIVTWNKKKYVLRLLEQLKNLNYPSDKIEFIVVDNDSSDGTAAAVESSYPQVKLIKNPENRGGAGGFNTGMRWVLQNRPDCKYLWLLDNDVLVHKDALKKLVEVMEKNPRAGICGSKIMDIDRPWEMIEVGAFIDYHFGDVRRNLPPWEKLRDPDAVFEVDYVAACSLLARTRFVKEMGIWHEKFFIYWDDMEWGARFNATGYKVLASNASTVYHPSWGGRTADNSAIWRNYYRIRNALWFYNNYSSGLKKRFLLACMILRYMRHSAGSGIRAQTELSRAYIRGVRDFFSNSYGKKNIYIPPEDLKLYLSDRKKRNLCVFIPHRWDIDAAKEFLSDLRDKFPGIKFTGIVPEADVRKWHPIFKKGDMITYRRLKNGNLSWADKYNIMKFLGTRSWNLLITTHLVPKMGVIWGRDVVRIDFEKEKPIASAEKMNFKDLCRIPFATLSFLFQVLFRLPEKDADNRRVGL